MNPEIFLDDTLLIGPMVLGEEDDIIRLTKKVFDEFVAPDFSAEGIRTFYEFNTREKIKERIATGGFILTAKIENEKIVGVIEIRDQNHIARLFVDKIYQKHGIAKKLFSEALSISINLQPDLKTITVHSSPFAVNIYKKLGFQQTDSEQMKQGIRYIPMRFEIL